MKPTKSSGVCSWVKWCLTQLALSGTLCAAEPNGAEFNKAAFDGNLERAKELLAKDPALLNSAGEGGTALGAAVFLARKDVVEFLLSKGADVELPSLQSDVPKGSDDPMPKRLSRTPLHLAAFQGYPDIIKLLLAAKANPSASSEDGTTVLHMAATYDRPEVVELLLNAKADANARDMDGATPLHYSAMTQATSAALIAAGGDIHAKAEKGAYAGKTPLEINPRLELFASLAPNWAKSDRTFPPQLAADAHTLKYLSVALREFSAKYGAYPNEETAARLERSFNGAKSFGVGTANDFFLQLFYTTKFKESVGAHATMTSVSAKPNSTCSYIPGGSILSRPERPVAAVPLLAGKTLFDPAPLGGKALVLFADCSLRHLTIEADGRVLLNGRDIFDPKQPFWEGKEPKIKPEIQNSTETSAFENH